MTSYFIVPTTMVTSLILVLSIFLPLSANSAELEELIAPAFDSGLRPRSLTLDSGVSVAPKSATQYDHGDPTIYEQLMLELVNRARSNPGAEATRLGIDLNKDLPAGTIEDTPKQPLASQSALIIAARAHCQWMLDNDVFSHTGVDSSDPGDRMRNAGYVFSGSWSWGENISWGGTTGTPDIEAQTIARHESLFLSAGHRENLCNGLFDEVGLGIVEGVFTVSSQPYNAVMVTQAFALSDATPGPLLLGVVFADIDGDGFYDPGEGVPGVIVSVENGQYYAETSLSGGYALPHPAGTGSINITFSGPALPMTVPRTINRTGENIKLDLNTTDIRMVEFARSALYYSETLGLQFVVSGFPDTEFELQHSTNLVGWVAVQNHTIEGEDLSLSHKPQDPSGTHFYRLAWTP